MELIGYDYFNFPVTDEIYDPANVAWTTAIPDANGKKDKAEF